MDEVVELDTVKNVCRLCLSTEEPKSPIFSVDESPISLADKIQACLSIEVASNDKLSTLICKECAESVRRWHSYKESCLKSQETLQKWLTKQINNTINMVASIKPEPMEDEDYKDTIGISGQVEKLSQDNDHNSVTPIDDIFSSESQSKTLDKSQEKNSNIGRGEKRRRSMSLPSQNAPKHPAIMSIEIKSEPDDDYETDCNIEVESATESELLINPMALATNKDTMESDSTKKFASTTSPKKKIRRGPHTHFRGVKVFKRKCPHCQIHLHSKFSYAKHMERYHQNMGSSLFYRKNKQKNNGELSENIKKSSQIDENPMDMDDEEELVEDVEDELVSMEKNAPLTQVQENIISQLKTFSCYSCQQVFNDRRSTLNHIRQHMPDLRPYTCIACLTEFPDRSIYKLHCGASFECAMKIALVIPKHGTEKYFTCNMCLRPLPNRKDLLSHLSKHSDRQYEQLTAPHKSPPKLKAISNIASQKSAKYQNSGLMLGPYKNGDPLHNHNCDYCGMIYKYKPNMVKHQELCKRLPPSERNCYRCAHCGMTFLVFKKFQSHTHHEHHRRDTVCYRCGMKFKFSNEFLTHHKNHQASILENSRNNLKNNKSSIKSITKFGCPLCPQEFSTRSELQEHRSFHHLQSKNLSCGICRKKFTNSNLLQEHLLEHDSPGLSSDVSSMDFNNEFAENQQNSLIFSGPNHETGQRSTECRTCGKSFANYPNLRRHIRTAHIVDGRFCCPKCPKTFTSEDVWTQHADRAHPRDLEAPAGIVKCQQCKKVFSDAETHGQHLIEAHGINEDDHLACDICGKRFSNETSLKIHRGHHFRRDSRLSIRNIPNPMEQVQVEIVEGTNELNLSPIKPAKAKKSFPYSPTSKSPIANSSLSSNFSPIQSANLQCAVCDDTFGDVHDLRKHLWDVHCAKNKTEKTFTEDLQCELCTNVFSDEQALEEHMKWHKENPILADVKRPIDITCDICGKFYSSMKSLIKHKKLHDSRPVAANMKLSSIKKNIPAQYPCPVCRKVFNNEMSMKKHKAGAHYARKSLPAALSPKKNLNLSRGGGGYDNEIRPKRPKLDFDVIRKAYHLGEPSGSSFGTPNTTKKPVTCGICKKLLPSMSSLYKHRQNVHKTPGRSPLKLERDIDTDDGVQCIECFKIFSNTTNMKQHYTKVHGNGEKYYCTIDDCNEEFDTSLAKQAHGKSHLNSLYACTLCSRYMFNRGATENHLMSEHKLEYEEGGKNLFRRVDLSNYEVAGAEGRVCPVCFIKYPNIKAMKIHYVKIHEGNT